MADLVGINDFSDVRRIETTDKSLGGNVLKIDDTMNSPLNFALQGLVNRTEYLRQLTGTIQPTVPEATESRAGKIRFQTAAEARQGINNQGATTPALTRAAIQAVGIAGGTWTPSFLTSLDWELVTGADALLEARYLVFGSTASFWLHMKITGVSSRLGDEDISFTPHTTDPISNVEGKVLLFRGADNHSYGVLNKHADQNYISIDPEVFYGWADITKATVVRCFIAGRFDF